MFCLQAQKVGISEHYYIWSNFFLFSEGSSNWHLFDYNFVYIYLHAVTTWTRFSSRWLTSTRTGNARCSIRSTRATQPSQRWATRSTWRLWCTREICSRAPARRTTGQSASSTSSTTRPRTATTLRWKVIFICGSTLVVITRFFKLTLSGIKFYEDIIMPALDFIHTV